MNENLCGLHLLVRNARFVVDTPARAAFKLHLQTVAHALHVLEVAEDGSKATADEVKAIQACLVGGSKLGEET